MQQAAPADDPIADDGTGPERVVLVRHGATEWSEEGRHTGWTDLPLNGAGIGQARAVRAALTGDSFSAVFCSPLQRARMTCMLAGYGDDAIIDPDLREWNYGAYEGRTAAEIREHIPGWVIWRNGVVGGESLSQVAMRADRFLERVRGYSGSVAVFAHGHLLRILAARWIGQDPHLAQSLALGTAATSTLAHEHEWRTIKRWNDTSHLR